MTTYEKMAEKHLLEDETLWSVYNFNHNLACVTDIRLIFINTNSNNLENEDKIPLSKVKAISTRHSSRLKSIVSIHSGGEVFHLKIETERVDRFVNDILKHKNANNIL